MPLEFTPASRGILPRPSLVGQEEYEHPEDAFVFRAQSRYRRATINVSVALRKLYYLEQALARRGGEAEADVMFEIRCSHIRAMMSIFNGREREPKPKCLEFHFETRSVQVPCPDDEMPDADQ